MGRKGPRAITEMIGTCSCGFRGFVVRYKGAWCCGNCVNPPDQPQRATDFLSFQKADPLENYPNPPSQGDLIKLQQLLRMKRRAYQKGKRWEGWDDETI